MQYSDLQTYVLDRLSILANDTSKVTQVKSQLNVEMYRLHERGELILTTANVSVTGGTNTGTLPTDLMRIKSLLNGTAPLQPITEQVALFEQAFLAAGGVVNSPPQPINYVFRFGSPPTIRVFPTPTTTTTLNLVYVQQPTAMVNNADLPGALPLAYHDFLAELVVERIAMSEESSFPYKALSPLLARMDGEFMSYCKRIAGETQARVALQFYG